jgi:hypothetical protein
MRNVFQKRRRAAAAAAALLKSARSNVEPAGRLPNYADGVGLWALGALRDLELDPLAILEGLVTIHLDGGEVNENIRAVVDRDEAVALLGVEPLNGALSHCALP